MKKSVQTAGKIAKSLDCPLWKVQYIIDTRKIKPDYRVGAVRVFSPESARLIKKEFRGMRPWRRRGA